MVWLDRNHLVKFQGIQTVFDPVNIGKNPGVVAVIPARKIDLSGCIVLHGGKGNVISGPMELMNSFFGAQISRGGHINCRGQVFKENGAFIMSEDKNTIQKEIKASRKDEKAWPGIHYLWSLNPVVEWINDKLLAAFGRHEAPVIKLETFGACFNGIKIS